MMALNTAVVEFSMLSEDECWQAILDRDRRFDGLFVTAVRSTGIYCRPSCPARKPHRKNVIFLPDADAAESAGFRPCKRCTPQTQAYEVELVERVCRTVEASNGRVPSLSELGARVNVSPSHLQRMFKRVTGISPRQYAEVVRLDQFKAHLKQTPSVTHALYAAGYGSSSAVYERSHQQLGMTPLSYRSGGRGMHIRYTTAECYLGRLLVGATDLGICALSLGDTDEFLEGVLRADYPEAQLERDDAHLGEIVCAVLNLIEGDPPHPEVPLDIQATAFQRRVWEMLQAIPRGETRTYSQIARALGSPDGARAVARACATNPIPILIPCHRVVRQDGDLGGYRWGLDRKRQLLDHEREKAR